MASHGVPLIRAFAAVTLVAACGTAPLPTPSPGPTNPLSTASAFGTPAPTDGRISWALVSAPELVFDDGFISDVLIADEMVVVAGGATTDDGTLGRIWVSRDALQWQVASLGEGGDTAAIDAMAASDEFLVAAGTGCCPESAVAWRSSDGQTWARHQQPAFDGGSMWDLALTPTGVLGLGCNPADTCEETALWHSGDGVTWEQLATSGLAEADLNAVVWSGAQLIGTGTKSLFATGPAVIIRSPDGEVWQAAQLPTMLGTLNGVATIPTVGMAAVGARSDTADGSGTGVLLTSPDGSQWLSVESPAFANASFADIAGKGDALMIGGSAFGPNDEYPGAWLSLDGGRTWQASGLAQLGGLPGTITAVDVLADGRFIAGGYLQIGDVSQPAIWIGTLVE